MPEQRKVSPRSLPRQRWTLDETDHAAAAALAKEARLPQVLAELLVARGIAHAARSLTPS